MDTNQKIAVQVRGVKKKYRLGQIGGGTLQADLQSWWARMRGKEDPNTKIGTDQRLMGQTFMALNGVDLTIYQGEAVGIIGSNGAGKSTLLKLLSRVTAPTEGEIDIYGRIASMLEVGTGFNGEMTGRENVYMNGAILGMSKGEIDAKMDKIIEFSEVGDFIDTPVKRYSSGMFVKLAFSVAAHLDAEIMIMDEVLAVGDMNFQTKCLNKMKEAAQQEGRTVLYVSHNMNTIRRLCDRCIVLDQGRVVFQGDVEQAIGVYLGINMQEYHHLLHITPKQSEIYQVLGHVEVAIQELDIANMDGVFKVGDKMQFCITVHNTMTCEKKIHIRMIIRATTSEIVTMFPSDELVLCKGQKKRFMLEANISHLVPGNYSATFVVYELDAHGNDANLDVVRDLYTFSVKGVEGFNHNMPWKAGYWGHIAGDTLSVYDKEMDK